MTDIQLANTRGTNNPNAKLTDDKVREIRRRVAAGETRQQVAESVGISYSVVREILQGKRWRHVE